MSQPVTLQPLRFDPSCADCVYCKVDPDASKAAKSQNLQAPEQGVCNRYPPTSQLLMTAQGPMSLMVKVVVPLDHWCGEFKGKSVSC